MNLLDLAKLGKDEIVRMAKAGELAPRHLWIAMKGAAEYQAAVARGDIAHDVTQKSRADQCAECPSHTESPADLDGVVKLWCGRPYDPLLETVLPVCGCLVALRINGEIQPGARPAVASKRCPQEKWADCRPLE